MTKQSTSTTFGTAKIDIETTMDAIKAMRHQESNGYRIPTQHLEQLFSSSSSSNCSSSNGEEEEEKKCDDNDDYYNNMICEDDLIVYLEWRSSMVTWCYNIVQSLKFHKETVEIAISMLDRYVAKQPAALMLDPTRYQLSCMTCLYLAAKVHESQCLAPTQMVQLSGGRFTEEHFTLTEQHILSTIQWRVNPPTAMSFVRQLVNLLPLDESKEREVDVDGQGSVSSSSTSSIRQFLLETAEKQIEVSMTDKYFVPIKKSSLACSVLINALSVIQHVQYKYMDEYEYDALYCFNNKKNNSNKRYIISPQAAMRLFTNAILQRKLSRSSSSSSARLAFQNKVQKLQAKLQSLLITAISSGGIVLHADVEDYLTSSLMNSYYYVSSTTFSATSSSSSPSSLYSSPSKREYSYNNNKKRQQKYHTSTNYRGSSSPTKASSTSPSRRRNGTVGGGLSPRSVF